MSDKEDLNKDNKKPDANYWRSFRELHQDPEFIEASHHEFAKGATDDFDPKKLSSISRRKFIALLGASAALAGAGCSDYRDQGHIIPYDKKPEEITVGIPNYFASTINDGDSPYGVLIKTREGRPIKIDGNPDHPVSMGKVSGKCQASILSLYDPERLQNPMKKSSGGGFSKIGWNKVDSEVIEILSNAGSNEIAIVSQRIISPTEKKLLEDFKSKYPSANVYSYDVFNDSVKDSAWRKCYGSGKFPIIKWNDAKIILALESDFIGLEKDKVENIRLYADRRDVKDLDNFNRLYVAEGNMSVTGSSAEYRINLRPDAQLEFVNTLIKAVSNSNPKDSGLLSFAKKYYISEKKLNLLVGDLLENKGKSIVYSGYILPEEVHVAVNKLNVLLENEKLYNTDVSNVDIFPLSPNEDWQNLVDKMNRGEVAAVIHLDSNPAYHFPDDLGYNNALNKVPNVISLVESGNESSELGNYILPINHPLEAWGDYKTRTGFYSMQQPVINPLYNTRQKEAVLLQWMDNSKKFNQSIYHDYIMNNWQEEIYPTLNAELDFKRFWLGALHDGVVRSQDTPNKISGFNNAAYNPNTNENLDGNSYCILLKESYATGDGKFANNGWLQELPHPVSKVTWDNYAAISLATSKELGVKTNDIIDINIDGRKLSIPVLVQPGAADKTVSIELGYGRTKIGVVGEGVGFDASVLMTKKGGLTPWIYSNVSVKKGNGTHKLVSAQEHHAFDVGESRDPVKNRGILIEGTVDEYRRNHNFVQEDREEVKKQKSIFPVREFTGVKWAMAVDLNKCIGCGECVIACNAENNIPIVGKDQVAVGREMQWLRIDTYYAGTPEDPQVNRQLMLCQQCDMAPCESVCPVLATTHSPDGLNQMIYNRCVGTRYCSNNCPYKVRRFNFFNFRDHFRDQYQESESFDLVYNPEVTVRSRGVMEKCTFCVQRIMNARSNAIKENREIKGSDVTTACQDACNARAIHFGDMNDKESEFYKYRNHELGYYCLEELNTRPNVTYLAKLRNTHKEEA
jgi:molybdopterin-containing oxidoreductase family iron-sulfur binding subunit